jgi:hypothetical protein
MARDFLKERQTQLGKQLLPVSEKIIAQIRPILETYGPLTQGAVVAELGAIWIAGHHPTLRAKMLKVFLETVVEMVALHDPWAEK